MDSQVLLATAILLIALPMTGTVCAMALGVLLAMRRRPWGTRLIAACAWLDPLTTWMRLAARWLGSSLHGGPPLAEVRPARTPTSPPIRASASARADRRHRERRHHARRCYRRLGRERRETERRHAIAG